LRLQSNPENRMHERNPLALLILVLANCGASVHATPPMPTAKVHAVAPSEYRPVALPKHLPVRLLADQPAARTIVLPELRPAEQAAAKGLAVAPPPGKGRPLQIGFGRELPAAQRGIALSALQWQSTPQGSRVARVVVESTGAAAVRLKLALSAAHPGLMLRFVGDGVNAEVQGPYAASEIADANARDGGWWTPVLEGSRASVEIAAAPGVALDSTRLTLSRVAHLTKAGDALRPGGLFAQGIGASGACNFDVNCVIPQSQALIDMTKATARIVYRSARSDGR
jgi:hypothetical protein